MPSVSVKSLYTLIFGILGFIGGLLCAYAITACIAGTFWIFLFGDDVWPNWVGFIIGVAFVVTLLSVLVVSIKKGWRYAASLNIEDPQTTSNAVYHLLGTVIVFFSFIFFLYYNFQSREKVYFKLGQQSHDAHEINSHAKDVTDIHIEQIEKGIDLIIDVAGESDAVYRLDVDLVGAGYVREKITHFSQIVELKFPQQSFHFELMFDDLAADYYKVLNNYVLSFDEPFAMDESISVEASLNLVETPKLSREKMKALHLEPRIASALLKLSFSCDHDHCSIVQKMNAETPNVEPVQK
jgi:hypothetical protein